ncbi:phosphotransferase family protein [Oligoflexus tunisiensis]|uniref:phosphotransferase family protein n=1 Tax=Oligoflexus tunisiensis TaxID=708132 RepID=UPI00159F1150|nr:phosphotransferase [Oligoflexus tunisiensis]
MSDPSVLNDLLHLANSFAGTKFTQGRILSRRSDRLVIRVGSVVVKAHAPGTHADNLRARLELLFHEPMQKIFLTPLHHDVWHVSGQLLATLWPVGVPLEGHLGTAPWDKAACLLAQLHSLTITSTQHARKLPRCRAMKKVGQTLAQLEDAGSDPTDPAVKAVLSAARTLNLDDDDGELTTMVHGDWHFGQLLSLTRGDHDTLRLIDPDDMGLGDPAWDLARPAAFFAAGLIPPDVWMSFLKHYRNAGGPAIPEDGDPWLTLEKPARALIVQCAASALIRARRKKRSILDAERPLLEACQRIASMSSQA